jgi:hypothetical protein
MDHVIGRPGEDSRGAWIAPAIPGISDRARIEAERRTVGFRAPAADAGLGHGAAPMPTEPGRAARDVRTPRIAALPR